MWFLLISVMNILPIQWFNPRRAGCYENISRLGPFTRLGRLWFNILSGAFVFTDTCWSKITLVQGWHSPENPEHEWNFYGPKMGLPDSHATPMFETPMESIWKEWVGGPISQRVEPEPWGRLSGLICIACLKVRNPRARQGLLSKKKTARRSSVILMVQNGSWFVVINQLSLKLLMVIDGKKL